MCAQREVWAGFQGTTTLQCGIFMCAVMPTVARTSCIIDYVLKLSDSHIVLLYKCFKWEITAHRELPAQCCSHKTSCLLRVLEQTTTSRLKM